MKLGRKLLITLNFLLLPVVGVLSNVLAVNFPTLPIWALWIGTGTIFLAFTGINVALASSEARQNEAVSLERSHQEKKQSSHLQKLRKTPSLMPSSRQDTLPPQVAINAQQSSNSSIREDGQPSIEHPMLLCLAIDVSDSMKQPILDHTGETIRRWTSVSNAVENFVHLGVAWVKDPGTQHVLPLYHLMAYGFGFKETMHGFGMRKSPGGAVRDLLAHPSLTSLPSATELSEHWNDYKNHLLSMKAYTGDLFGSTPMCQALTTIRDRISAECNQRSFTFPVLLLIISDGLSDDGDPLPLIEELHTMNVMTLCCYLADRDVLAPRQLYDVEENSWSSGAKLLFRCASTLYRDTYVSQAMFDYLSDHGWHPHEGVRLFAQVNQAEAPDSFLEVLLRGSSTERRA